MLEHLRRREAHDRFLALTRLDAGRFGDVWTALVSSMPDLHAVEHEDALFGVFAAGFIEPLVRHHACQ